MPIRDCVDDSGGCLRARGADVDGGINGDGPAGFRRIEAHEAFAFSGREVDAAGRFCEGDAAGRAIAARVDEFFRTHVEGEELDAFLITAGARSSAAVKDEALGVEDARREAML